MCSFTSETPTGQIILIYIKLLEQKRNTETGINEFKVDVVSDGMESQEAGEDCSSVSSENELPQSSLWQSMKRLTFTTKNEMDIQWKIQDHIWTQSAYKVGKFVLCKLFCRHFSLSHGAYKSTD